MINVDHLGGVLKFFKKHRCSFLTLGRKIVELLISHDSYKYNTHQKPPSVYYNEFVYTYTNYKCIYKGTIL